MNRLRSGSLVKWLLVLVALVPAGLFAYLGHFSRMMRDDYYNFALAREYGPLAFMLRQRNSWSGSYSDSFFYGLVGPVGPKIVQIMPVAIIVLWYFGLIWLLVSVLKLMKLERHRVAIATSLASLMLTATINAFYSMEALFWYTASVRYALPLALLTIGIAAATELIRRCRSLRGATMLAVPLGLFFFINAGFSEMYLIFQFCTLSLILVGVLVFVCRSRRRLILIPIVAGWLATLLSALVQITAPGVGLRADWYVGGGVTIPIRSISQLLPVTMNLTLQYVADQYAFAGFALLFAAGFLLLLIFGKPVRGSIVLKAFSIPAVPLWLGLMVQLCFLPILWSHSSDFPQILGRFSYSFMVVICLNTFAISAYLLMLQQRDKVSVLLQRSPNHVELFSVILWGGILALFGLTQIRSIHYWAAGHLYLSAISLLGLLSCIYASAILNKDVRRGGASVVICLAATVLTAFVLLGIANYSIGYVRDRAMVPVSWLQAITGLVWGAQMGYWLKRKLRMIGGSSALLNAYKLASLLVVVTIGTGIFLGRLHWLPDLRAYAREWDARHQSILDMRASGLTRIEVAPLTYDLSRIFWEADMSTNPENRSAKDYYDLESIEQVEG